MRKFVSLLQCAVGFHSWNPDIPEAQRWAVKRTGVDVLFSSQGIQKAIQHCKYCDATRKVYREGWLSLGLGPQGATEWRRCPLSLEQQIDLLPPL